MHTFGMIKSQGIDVSVSDDLPIIADLPIIHVDRMKIEEILVNLIENGIECKGEKQHPRIEIGCRTEADETMFFARDNRTGIDPSQLQ